MKGALLLLLFFINISQQAFLKDGSYKIVEYDGNAADVDSILYLRNHRSDELGYLSVKTNSDRRFITLSGRSSFFGNYDIRPVDSALFFVKDTYLPDGGEVADIWIRRYKIDIERSGDSSFTLTFSNGAQRHALSDKVTLYLKWINDEQYDWTRGR